jgi:Domain of unknown function (DUF305)
LLLNEPTHLSILNLFLIEHVAPGRHPLDNDDLRRGAARGRSAFFLEGNMVLFTRAFFRRRMVSMVTTLTVSATSFALAQDPGHGHHFRTGASDGNERQFLFASDLAISDMSRAMLIPPSGDVDRDFVAMMIPRDQATIDMAHAELQYGHDDELRRLAQSIIDRQQREISIMNEAIGHAIPGSASLMSPAASQAASASRRDLEPQD